MNADLVLTFSTTGGYLSSAWRQESAIPDGETQVWPWVMRNFVSRVIGDAVPMDALTNLTDYVRREFAVPDSVTKENDDYRALLREAALVVFGNMGVGFRFEIEDALR